MIRNKRALIRGIILLQLGLAATAPAIAVSSSYESSPARANIPSSRVIGTSVMDTSVMDTSVTGAGTYSSTIDRTSPASTSSSNSTTKGTSASGTSSSGTSAFFGERYRGWLWFEEKEALVPEADIDEEAEFIPPTKEEMQRAKTENDVFKEELELMRHMMIRYPENLDYVVMYKKKEQEMHEGARKLSRSWVMANFLNPDMTDELENPQNIYGRKLQKSLQKKQDKAALRVLASQIEIFVFRKEDCPYCKTLEKHLSSFARMYGFKVEAVSADGSSSQHFKTHTQKELIEALSLDVMPMVIAVTNDSSMRFELARGAVSILDLENKSLMLVRYLESLKESGSAAGQELNNGGRR